MSRKAAAMQSFADLEAYCLAKPGASLDFPFGPEIGVFRVGAKMFALSAPDAFPLRVNLKCEPRLAELLRESYEAVKPGWHMNKRHWNTVTAGGDLPDELLREQIDRSYALVLAGLPKKQQRDLLLRAPD